MGAQHDCWEKGNVYQKLEESNKKTKGDPKRKAKEAKETITNYKTGSKNGNMKKTTWGCDTQNDTNKNKKNIE